MKNQQNKQPVESFKFYCEFINLRPYVVSQFAQATILQSVCKMWNDGWKIRPTASPAK